MFLDRSTGRGSSEQSSLSDRRRSRLVALGLAVGAATPLLGAGAVFAQAAEPTTQPAAPTADAAAPAPASTDGKDLYFQGREYYYKGDWIAARKAFDASKAAGYEPGGLTRSQDWFLEKMTAKEQSDAEKSQKEAAAAAKAAQDDSNKSAQAQADAAAAAARDAAAKGDAERKAQAQSAYDNGVSQYKKGDWIAARSSFNTAVELNYKAGWTETSPSTYLEKMTTKEQADAAKHAAELTAAQAQADAAARAAAAEAARGSTPVNAAVQTEPAAPAGNGSDLAATAALQRAREVQRAAESRDKVVAARKAIDEKRYDDASALLTDALNIDPSNDDARNAMAYVQALQNKSTNGTGLLGKQAEIVSVRRQEVIFNFGEAMNKAATATAADDFASARNAITAARVAREAAKTDFTAAELVDFDSRIAQAQIALDQAQARKTADDLAARNKGTAEQERKKADAAASERENTIRAYVKNATDLVRENKFREASGVIHQILLIDPNNDYALGAKPYVEDQANFREQRTYREMYDVALTHQLNAAEEKKIPYDEILRYPTDWPELSARRDQTVAAEQGDKQIDKATQATLDRRLPELRFDNVGFADVIDFLRDVTGANIFVNWKALEAASIDRNAPVTARLRDIPFRKALTIILESVGGATKLGYTIDEGVITISTADDLAKNVLNRVYDIRDLIIDIPDFSDAPNFSLQNATSSSGGGSGSGGGGGGGGGGGSGGGLFGGSGGSGGASTDKSATRKELVDALIKLIQDTVAADTWRDAGGTVGSIRELGGQLIVTQTPENQQLLQNLLEKLRETRAIQVTIETRFLTVQRNFLEDIGVDLDATFNINGTISNKLTPITVGSDTATLAAGAQTGVPGSLGGTYQTGGANGGAASGLSIAGSFIDDFQVNFLLRATQANTNTTILTAPRVTLFNGQRAYVLVATQRAYVSNLTPTVANNAVAFAPTVSVVSSGVLLDVQATVSSDRKYVTLTLRPQLAQLLDLFSFTFTTGAPAPTPTPTPAPTPTPTPVPPATAGTGLIQEPELQITEVRTSVSVPDGGTLLLGGQTLAGETQKEVGVPILSKIPFLKRIFTNTSTAKDEQILLILVKPTIIIQREEEAKQFPLLSSKVSGG